TIKPVAFFFISFVLPVVLVIIIVIIALIILLLLLLSLSLLLIKDIGIQYRADQLMLVYCASNRRKMVGGVITTTSRRVHRGLRLSTN
ncbi:unnamed protein product, partial [Sphagnum compactum]